LRMDYKQKYDKLKRRVKSYVLENASLVDEVSFLQGELVAARSERLTLIEKLMSHEGLEKNTITSNSTLNESRNPLKNLVSEKQNPNVSKKGGENEFKEILKQNQRNVSIFPLKLNNILIHTLGEIIPSNPNFHTAEWIYPVGYVATRIYAHPRDPKKKCVYTCKILNNAGVPQFQLIPDNDLDGVFFGATANICHQELLNAIMGSIEAVKAPFKAKGEVFFGLSHQKVQSLLTMDIKSKQCSKFKGFLPENALMCESTDPTISFTELQSWLT
ncbi:hypothetical protein KR222_008387, partial [Zaprionus bogoriensis]